MNTKISRQPLKERLSAFVANFKQKGISETLRQALKWRVNELHIRFHQRKIKGLPKGINFSTLDDFCTQTLEEHLLKTSYRHLSGWKTHGAYRLMLETTTGKQISVIYKDALYDLDQIPALKNLPVIPGPPEYVIYSNRREPLSEYLPEVYMCVQVALPKHYRYLFEDISEEYQRPSTCNDLLRIVGQLSRLHERLLQWSNGIDPHQLLYYDQEFSQTLQPYIQSKVEKYFSAETRNDLARVKKHWEDIITCYQNADFFHPNLLCPIHGDLNTANIFLHKSHPERMKFLDWEWAGWGMPHADLAAILKSRTTELVQKALHIYAAQHPELSYHEHQRLYHWCQLGRQLLDAAFFASQAMETSRRTRINLRHSIEQSLIEVLQTYQTLQMVR